MWSSEHFFAPKPAAQFVKPIVFVMVEQIWREKMSEKPHSIRLLRWFNFSQSGSRKTIEKALKELPWNQQHSLSDCRFIYLCTKNEVPNKSNLVPRAARTSPSQDFTARSDSRSYLAHLDFDWPKDIQIRIYLIGLKIRVFEVFMEWNARV